MAQEQDYQKDFLNFQGELKSFIYRLVTNHQDAEDLAQETYIKAFQKIDTFRGESSFKTWVFAIAVNHSKNFLKSKERWREDYQDNCRTVTHGSEEIQGAMVKIAMDSAHGKFVIKEHIDYCFTCMSKTLLLEEQICLMLKEVYEFTVLEIIHITQLTEGKIKYHLSKSRKRLQEIFDNKCSIINKQGICHQCSELNGMFNPRQDAQIEINALKLVKEREKSNYEELMDLRLELVRAIDPVNSEGYDLHNYMLENLPSHSN